MEAREAVFLRRGVQYTASEYDGRISKRGTLSEKRKKIENDVEYKKERDIGISQGQKKKDYRIVRSSG